MQLFKLAMAFCLFVLAVGLFRDISEFISVTFGVDINAWHVAGFFYAILMAWLIWVIFHHKARTKKILAKNSVSK